MEKLIRQIVRDEVQFYLRELAPDKMAGIYTAEKSEQTASPFDYDLFEAKYQAAVQIGEEVSQKYEDEIQQHGKSVTL